MPNTAIHTATGVVSPSKFGYEALFQRQQPLDKSLFSRFILICGLTLIYRVWISQHTPIPLFFDEAYYLSWAQHLDWGYYSKPPMVAWLITLTTSVFGNASWAVKLAAPTLYAASSVLIYLCGLKIAGNRAGFYSALVFLFMPLVAFNSLFITTDAPLLFFWALAWLCFLQALQSNNFVWWLAAGLAGGLGLLSKYTFILLPCAFLLYATMSALGRQLLANPRFWLACTVALACLLPNLYWNYQHDFISFQHTAEISKQAETGFDPIASLGRGLEFFAGQSLVFGLVFFIVLLRCGFQALSNKSASVDDTERLLWSLFLPCFALIGLQAFTARANVNWAAPSYIAASLLVGRALTVATEQQGMVKWWRAGLAFNLVLMLSFYHYAAFTEALGIERKKGSDPFKRVLGWEQLAQTIQPTVNRYPDTPIVGSSRKVLSYFGYYLQPQRFEPLYFDGTAHIGNHYELRYPLRSSEQRELLYIGNWPEQKLRQYFQQVEKLDYQQLDVYSNFSREISVYRVRYLQPESTWP